MEDSLFVDQSLIQAPNFPRSREWWQRRLPVWLDASIDDRGRVKIEPNGWVLDGSFEELSPAERLRELKAARDYLAQRPHLAVALVGGGGGEDGTVSRLVNLRLPGSDHASSAA